MPAQEDLAHRPGNGGRYGLLAGCGVVWLGVVLPSVRSDSLCDSRARGTGAGGAVGPREVRHGHMHRATPEG